LNRAGFWRRLRALGLGFICSACALAVDVDELDNGECEEGTKACAGADGRLSCVSEDLPSRGCAGESCAPCVVENAIPRCSAAGRCTFTGCLDGYADCDGNPLNGCEIDVRHDPNHCGDCDAEPCSVPNAIAGCAAGVCAVDHCDAGFKDCNGLPEDGCEAELAMDVDNCGACNQACDESETCEGGTCV
jgi:hypothetical protein